MKTKEENMFWIVVNVNFPTRVSYKHAFFASAENEALRLARENPGEKFAVLGSICSFLMTNLERTDYVDRDKDIPF